MPQESFPTQKAHVSFSEVREWAECSYRHKLHHVDKIDINRPSIHASFGKAVHSFCENFLKNRIPDQKIYDLEFDKMWLDVTTSTQKIIDELEVKTDRNVIEEKALLQLKKSQKDLTDHHRQVWYQQGIDIIAEIPKFVEDQFPEWEFLAAEQTLYENIEKHELSFKGFIDGVIKAKGPRGKPLVWIIDWKTCSFGWNFEKKSDPMVRAQLVFYKHFWAQKMSVDIKDVRCGFVLLKRTAKPENKCELIPVSVGEVTIGRSLKILDNMITSVRKGTAIKNRNSCKYCDFKDTKWCT